MANVGNLQWHQVKPRRGDWMQTFTGRQFWPLDPRPVDVFIEDIAHHLSMQCRYAGACIRFYSVAEHSVLLTLAMPRQFRLAALMHDSPESYLQDIIRPIKPSFLLYKWYEEDAHRAICKGLGIPMGIPQEVKDADNRIFHDEAAQNMATPPVPWSVPGKPLGVKLQFWTPKQAEFAFLTVFRALMDGDEEILSLKPWFLAGPVRLRIGRALAKMLSPFKPINV